MTQVQQPTDQARPRSAAALQRPFTVTPAGFGVRSTLPARRYEISWLTELGEVMELVRMAPALPVFESAFAAFARGALVQTQSGWVAVEDLVPGMMLITRSGPQPLRWIGRTILPPPAHRSDEGSKLYRLNPDALGPQRPGPDLVLCSGARIAQRTLRSEGRGPGEVLVPVEDFADDNQVVRITPAVPVAACHLALSRHDIINVNGVEVETFHPGTPLPAELHGDLARSFHALFPYLDGSRNFGPLALPRQSLDQIGHLTRSA